MTSLHHALDLVSALSLALLVVTCAACAGQVLRVWWEIRCDMAREVDRRRWARIEGWGS